jgi:hypothetical protein
MTVAKGFVVPAGGGRHFASPTPGRSFAMKLLGRETGESIMMFEETLTSEAPNGFRGFEGLCLAEPSPEMREGPVALTPVGSGGRLGRA